MSLTHLSRLVRPTGMTPSVSLAWKNNFPSRRMFSESHGKKNGLTHRKSHNYQPSLNTFDAFPRMRDLWSAPFGNILKEFEPFFDTFQTTNSMVGWNPRADISETKDAYFISLEVAGVPKDDIHIDITDNVLTIHGEKKQEDVKEEEGKYYRRERSFGSFSRSFSLPEGVQPSSIKASYDAGVLKVTIPRQTAPKESHKIVIEAESK